LELAAKRKIIFLIFLNECLSLKTKETLEVLVTSYEIAKSEENLKNEDFEPRLQNDRVYGPKMK
jgi:hypothetical protein